MANQDSFIDEVNEEVRRDRLYRLFRRYGPIALIAVVLLVAGAAWNEWTKAQARAEAEALGDAILAASAETSPAAREAALISLGTTPDSAAVTSLLAAAAARADGDAETAIERYDAIAANPEVDRVYRDLATLMSAMSSEGVISAGDRIARLQGIATPGAPFRVLAEEQIALAEVSRGGVEVAIEILMGLLTDADASQGLRQRAAQLIVALGGSLNGS